MKKLDSDRKRLEKLKNERVDVREYDPLMDIQEASGKTEPTPPTSNGIAPLGRSPSTE